MPDPQSTRAAWRRFIDFLSDLAYELDEQPRKYNSWYLRLGYSLCRSIEPAMAQLEYEIDVRDRALEYASSEVPFFLGEPGPELWKRSAAMYLQIGREMLGHELQQEARLAKLEQGNPMSNDPVDPYGTR